MAVFDCQSHFERLRISLYFRVRDRFGLWTLFSHSVERGWKPWGAAAFVLLNWNSVNAGPVNEPLDVNRSLLPTILDAPTHLTRLTTRLLLLEGTPLRPEDILQTSAGAFVQIEFPDADRLALGENTQVMLWPKLAGPKVVAGAVPRAYLLQGWAKVSSAGNTPVVVGLPDGQVSATGAVAVLWVQPGEQAVFVESGSVRLQPKGAAVVAIGSGQFASVKVPGKWTIVPRPGSDFIARLPRPFLDTLPSRAAKFTEPPKPLKPLGEVAYEDVAPWLRAEPAVRLPLLPRWRARLVDAAFRAGVGGELAAHPEWERALHPERYCSATSNVRVDAPGGCPDTARSTGATP